MEEINTKFNKTFFFWDGGDEQKSEAQEILLTFKSSNLTVPTENSNNNRNYSQTYHVHSMG